MHIHIDRYVSFLCMLSHIDVSSVLFSFLGVQTENMALIYCTIEPAVLRMDGILFEFLDSSLNFVGFIDSE
jgi:hypothetical protein